jgi:hypothetical protein
MQLKTVAVTAAALSTATATGLSAQRGTYWCAASPSEPALDALRSLSSAEAARKAAGDTTFLARVDSISIPVYMHAVVNTTVKSTFLNRSAMQKQLDVMNKAYAPHSIQFVLKGVTRKVDNNLSTYGDGSGSGAALEAYWKASRVGAYDTTNMWFYSNFPSDIFGACTLPQRNVPKSDYWQDGCHIASGTMPGAEIKNFNLGYTAVHELVSVLASPRILRLRA